MFRWLTRIRELDSYESMATPPRDIARVQLVERDNYRGSREFANCASAFGTLPAGAATHMVGIRLDGVDARSGLVLVRLLRFNSSQNITVFVGNPASFTFTEAELVPSFLDQFDTEVRPRIFSIDFLNTNIPAAAASGVCTQLPGPSVVSIPPEPEAVFWWPCANTGSNPSLFLLGNTAATAMQYIVTWQAVRL